MLNVGLADTLANIDKIETGVTELVALTKGALEIANINEKTI